jgi:hypothetical protein
VLSWTSEIDRITTGNNVHACYITLLRYCRMCKCVSGFTQTSRNDDTYLHDDCTYKAIISREEIYLSPYHWCSFNQHSERNSILKWHMCNRDVKFVGGQSRSVWTNDIVALMLLVQDLQWHLGDDSDPKLPKPQFSRRSLPAYSSKETYNNVFVVSSDFSAPQQIYIQQNNCTINKWIMAARPICSLPTIAIQVEV